MRISRALLWFSQTKCSIDDLSALDLLQDLDGLPLALAQAGSYMRETNTSITEYLELYNSTWDDLMKDEAETKFREYGNRSIRTTWVISFEQIRRQNKAATNMLQLWTLLDNRDIWFGLFNNEENRDLEQ